MTEHTTRGELSLEPLIIDVSGNNRDIGRQHALGAIHLRPAVQEWVATSTSRYPLADRSASRRLDEVIAAWEELTPGTLSQLNSMAQVYEVPARGLLTAVLASYLDCLADVQGPPEGCTAFSLSGPEPVLVKNRDNDRRFLAMQTVLRARPQVGHGWLALSTAGAPGVHSSGINAFGLCVVDTHVRSSDVGPGMPRFASMMHVLEQCTTTDEAIDYLIETPQMGLGTLTLLDAQGSMGVIECAFSRSAVLRSNDPQVDKHVAALVATNHYITTGLCDAQLESPEGTPGANSRDRRSVVIGALLREHKPVRSLDEVCELAGSHAGFDTDLNTLPGSICQHGPALKAETIATTIYDPIAREMTLCLGRPCRDPFTLIPVFKAPAQRP